MTVLLCGIPTDAPLAMVASRLQAGNTPIAILNQREFQSVQFDAELANGVRGNLWLGRNRFELDSFTGIYTRLMDDRYLPEVEDEPPDSSLRVRCRRLHDGLTIWHELASCRVVNRPGASASNMSKPFQALLALEHGFLVPQTIITNDPTAVEDFRRDFKRVVYKSISGVRSIVTELDDPDLQRLDDIRWCPVQFQEYVEGDDVRVHVVGSHVFATRIRSSATDYRYAHFQKGASAEFSAVILPADIEARCISMTVALGLAFAGIDFKLTPYGSYYCLEVNTSPAYSYYESHTGQPISTALAHYLAGE